MKTTDAFLIMCLVVMTNLRAADLNAPVEPPMITLGSEIYRGVSAAENCSAPSATFSEKSYAISQCAFRVKDENVQKNTATSSFLLGVYFDSWLTQFTIARISKTPNDIKSASEYFQTFREYQNKLKLSDEAVCKATQKNCEIILPMMREAGSAGG